ncbi:hypothetical protein [Streptomyces albireticuli]|uniref:Transcriptional regulator n=1 Tax=Streptomyces albireticuli TaxID=1940 RepID=A0A2A2D2S5_9ACTN|nr:hypothetical protein [Streptomyces albireticuli]MCD9195018.1 hypothetical protein [Streptomyces albireticuli]PAU46788.1 hypothetical protein CK936_22255 [Streptomyces albireticuli]
MTKRTPNMQLKALIDEKRLPYETIAHVVRAAAAESGEVLRTNRSTVEHWISGAQPAGNTPRYLAEALSRLLGRLVTVDHLGLSTERGEDDSIGLSLGPDPVETLTLIGKADVNRRRFLASSAYSVAAAALPLGYLHDIAGRAAAARSGAIAGNAEVAAVRDMVRVFTDMDELHGGQHGRSALVQYLMSDVATLCRGRFRTEEARRQMLSVAASGVHLAGWKSYDAGEQGLAQRYYLQCYALAAESGVPGHDGFVMRTMAQQGMKVHRAEHCLALAETGLDRAKGHVDPATEALFHVTYAHALAKTSQSRQALRAVERARACLDAAKGDSTPFWALAWGPIEGTVRSRTAKVFAALGDPRNAAQQYARAAAGRPPGTYARIIALDLVARAEIQAGQGAIEEACVTWGRAMDHMDGVASVRTRKAVRNMRRDLTRFRARGLRCAAELDERGRDFLTAHR